MHFFGRKKLDRIGGDLAGGEYEQIVLVRRSLNRVVEADVCGDGIAFRRARLAVLT